MKIHPCTRYLLLWIIRVIGFIFLLGILVFVGLWLVLTWVASQPW